MFAMEKSHYWKHNHNFGVLILKSVNEALHFDYQTKNDMCHKVIKKEMENVMPALKILERDKKLPIGYHHFNCHKIFDVKMDLT